MGNAALKQHFVKLLQHAHLLVKDLPYDELLNLSVLGVTATLQRLEFQERVLENLGIFVPFEILRASLEEVELRLSGLQLQILAKRFVLRCRAREESDLRAYPAELPRDVATQPLLMKCLNSLNVRVEDIEMILQMEDAEGKPWNLGVRLSAELQPLPLQMLQPLCEHWSVELTLQDLRVLCGCAESTEVRGVLFGPCDLEVHALGVKNRGPGASFSLQLAISKCYHGLRVNQYQLALLNRLSRLVASWGHLLRDQELDLAMSCKLKELLELTGQQPLGGAVLSISGAFPIELVDDSGEGSMALLLTGKETPEIDLTVKVQAEPWSLEVEVRGSAFTLELVTSRKVCLVDHVGDFLVELSTSGERKLVTSRLGDLRARLDPEEAMSVLLLLDELCPDPMGEQLEGEPTSSDWPLLDVSCAEPLKFLVPCGALQPVVLSLAMTSQDGTALHLSLQGWLAQSLSAELPGPHDDTWRVAARFLSCERISMSFCQDLEIEAKDSALSLDPLQLALLTRHLRRWGSLRQEAMTERRAFSSSFASEASPKNWRMAVHLHLPQLLVELPSSSGVWRLELSWRCSLDVESQGLSFHQRLQHLAVMSGERQLCRIPQPSSFAITVPFEAMKEQQWRGHLAPLWCSLDCGSWAQILDYLRKLREAFRELGEEVQVQDVSLDWEACLSVDLHCTFSQISFFLPSSAGPNPTGLLLSASATWCLRPGRAKLLVSNFRAGETLQSLSVAHQAESQVLHGCRMRLELEMDELLTGRMELSPVSVSLKTEHMPLLIRIWQYFQAMDVELAHFGTESSGPKEEMRDWHRRASELQQLAEVVQELIPACLLSFLRHAALLLSSSRLQFDLELPALHLGLVESSGDVELVGVLVEDMAFSLDRAAAFPSQAFSPLSVASPTSSAPSPRQVKRREHLAGRATLSVDITSTELARTSTLLEPVCVVMDLYEGTKHTPSSCKVSWVNLNLSSSLIDTLVSLYHDASERIAGLEPYDFSPSEPSPVYDAVACEGRGLQRQLSISSRQPELRVQNDLGQDLILVLESRRAEIAAGVSYVAKMPWCARKPQSGWNVKLQLAQMPEADVLIHLTATSAVKSVAVKPKMRTRSLSSAGGALLAGKCYTVETSGSNLDLSMPCTESWILVRTEVGAKLNELSVSFSSVLFVENRTEQCFSIGPYGTPAEGFLELPPHTEPRPIPLAWLSQPSLWVGVTEELKMPSFSTSTSSLTFGAVVSGDEKRGWMRSQRRVGLLQPLIGRSTWQAIRRYRSMVANDYFLRSRMLRLSNRRGDGVAVCATVCGVSADLQASLQALIFNVSLDPAAQICNRLPCAMRLATAEGTVIIGPGEDKDIIKPSQQLQLTLEVPTNSGADEAVRLHMETPVWADRLPREKHQKRLHFSEVNVQGKEADLAKLTVTLETEPGLSISEHWAPLQVRQYSPRSLRLVFFTQYWLLNRRSDCRVCIPQPELQATRAGVAKFKSLPNKRLSLMQFDCNTLQMISENLVRRGKIRVGLCDQRYNAKGESLVPVTQHIRINQPMAGSATAPRSSFNPVQRCFGYTVRPAPLPFYRTLLVEMVRRYTLLNHKEHVLYCVERDVSSPLELLAGSWAAFDPQGRLQIAITGVKLQERRPRAATTMPPREKPRSPRKRAVTWADRGEDLEAGEEKDEELESFSAPFGLTESSRRSFQLMHLCDLSGYSRVQQASLARPEPLLGPAEEVSGIGRAWCLTAVDALVEQSSVVIRFSEPVRPQFRILNRTGHTLGLRQDCAQSPWFELAPEHRMSFCWFQPEGLQRLRLRLGSQEMSYDIGTVEEHAPPLRVERPSGGAFCGVLREEFLVQTKVSKGSREVHVHPHCLLKNSKGHALLVRSGRSELVVPHLGAVSLVRDGKNSQVVLEIASCIPGSTPHWSAPIMLTKHLAGHRGFLRHMKSGGNGMTSVFEITMVDVKKDPISDFLVVELRPYVKANCPYFFENDSRQVCSVSQLDDGAPLELFPGESAPFVPMGAVCGQGTFPIRLAVLGKDDEVEYSSIIDIELPQELVLGSLRARVLKERPRHIILRDEKVKPRRSNLPPLHFLQRLLARQRPISPRRRTRHISPASPKKRRPTLALPLSSTPRLNAMPSTRSLGSRISKLRRGSLDIFWTIHGRKPSQRARGMVFELYVQGLGVTLIDSTSLNEVAFLCADTLVMDMVRYEGAQRSLELSLNFIQVDVHDNAGWRSNVMLRPQRRRLPVRVVRQRPVLSCQATWLALDRGAGPAAHLEVEKLKIDLEPIELRLDTLSCFQLALFGLDLLRRVEPLLEALPNSGHLRRLLKTRWRSDGEQLLVAQQGDSSDPVCGEPPCPEYDDFDVPTPVFIKQLLVKRVEVFISVRFNGKTHASSNSSEAVQALNSALRKLIPFDVSQARISLGPFFRLRPGAVQPKRCRLLRLGDSGGDASLRDEFLPNGFHELLTEASAACREAVLHQIPQFLGAQRLLGSPAHLCTELKQALHLAVFGLCSCSPWLLIAATFTVVAALLESIEGIFMIIAKTTCRITAGTVPTGLRKEPSGFPGALMDLVWYGFPWHAQQIYRECRRQSHIAYSSRSCGVTMCCLAEGTWYCLFSVLSVAMVVVAKLFQSLQLLCHTLAWYVCPERIAELGAPLSRRVGPLLFHLGSPLQYSHWVTSTMAVVHHTVRGTRLRDWRLQDLGPEGSLLAVQGSGFFLVRSSAIVACVPAREADVFLAWQAKGAWQRVELRVRDGHEPFLLCFHGDKMSKVLRLRSHRAAIMAFSFAQECVSSWAKTEVTQTAPETPKSRLLRRVTRSAAVRASG